MFIRRGPDHELSGLCCRWAGGRAGNKRVVGSRAGLVRVEASKFTGAMGGGPAPYYMITVLTFNSKEEYDAVSAWKRVALGSKDFRDRLLGGDIEARQKLLTADSVLVNGFKDKAA